MNKRTKGTIQLTLTALIWGIAFVAQSVGMEYVGPWTFNAVRYLIGGIVLIPVIFLISWINGRDADKSAIGSANTGNEPAVNKKDRGVAYYTVKGGIFSGILLAVASLLQQYGILYTSVGKAGFITALYIIIVPFFSILLKKKIGLNQWISALIAVAGFYIMSVSGYQQVNIGDLLLLACACFYSVQILVIDHYVERVNTVAMSCIQFFVSGIICSVGMFALENPQIDMILAAYIPILYAGVMSSGVAYTLQIIGQKNLEPTLASLLMSLESVFSALAGWIILKQIMQPKEIVGSVLVFGGVVLAQLPAKKNNA